MTACGLVKGRDADEPVDSGFCGQQSVGVFAFDSECHTLQSGFLTWLILEHFSFESTLLGPLEIHAQEHLGPVLRFGTTRARVNGANSIAAIIFAAEQHFRLGLAQVVFEPREQRLQFLERTLVFFGKLKEHFRVGDLRIKLFLTLYSLFQRTAILQ